MHCSPNRAKNRATRFGVAERLVVASERGDHFDQPDDVAVEFIGFGRRYPVLGVFPVWRIGGTLGDSNPCLWRGIDR